MIVSNQQNHFIPIKINENLKTDSRLIVPDALVIKNDICHDFLGINKLEQNESFDKMRNFERHHQPLRQTFQKYFKHFTSGVE